jgi:hypothetical protein
MKLSKAQKEILEKAGVTLESLTADIPTEENQATKERNEWEAQSLLTCLTWPLKEVADKKCIRCGEHFLTGYDKVSYCSNKCTELDLREHFGVFWNPKASFYEQWGSMEPPLLIGPRQIQAMRDLLSLIDQEIAGQTDNQEPDYEVYPEEPLESDSVSHDLPIPTNDPETQLEHPEEDADFLSLLDSFLDE